MPSKNDNILPLESFSLTAVPASTHNIAWSPDAELAIGCDDCVFIFLPEFSTDTFTADHGSEVSRQYNDAALRFPSVEHRHPDLNRHLFGTAEQEFPEFEHVPGGGGSGTITGQGSSMNHGVALEWSPSGLGRMHRSVLAVLTGAGAITVYCEGASDGMNGSKLRGRSARSLRPWVAAWGVGAGLLIPRADGQESEYSKEYITAFAWARDTDGRGTLMAYANDDDEVVILSVQAKHDSNATPGDCGQWRVEEVARFVAEGPHPILDPTDPDYSPSGSSFSLSWSPWLKRGSSKTSMISYVANNYVGFREVTVSWPRKEMVAPRVKCGASDSNGVCMHLAPDAFVVWEDLIWTIGSSKVCRGMIATPAKAQAFQVAFDSNEPEIASHTTDECGTTYPEAEGDGPSQNPITETPSYSLVRLSATHENDAWYQTNLPLPPNPEDGVVGPKWASDINQIVEHQLPRALANRLASDLTSVRDEEGSDDGDDEMEEEEEERSEFDPNDAMAGIDTEDQVHVNRVRIWGMTASPGGGVIAVFATQYGTMWPGRDTFAGHKCRVLFGRYDSSTEQTEEANSVLAMKKLSTEARAWEWMYGGGPPVAGVGVGMSTPAQERDKQRALKDHFATVSRSQVCPFCELPLAPVGKSSRCQRGHILDTCATTGLPILAPGLSKMCNVCGSKCLKPEDLVVVAPQLKDIIMGEISSEFCGGCGGKFVN
ncbi:transcription factor IIIC subunit delta N-term-domain-containing protein [Hypoxylon cercidicola]|nr:transcription factor IIIC subunit delta N-term-domain-containing protein [Hypoxylon cercidicola]